MSQLQQLQASPNSNATQEHGIDILELLLVLARDRRRIVVVTLVALVLGGTLSFLIASTFTATATILPPQQQESSASALMGQLSSLAGLGGGGGLLKNPADMYVSMLTSRTVLDRTIDRFHLQTVYKTKSMDATRRELKANIATEAGKDGLIQIAVKDTDPRRASDLTNGVIEELYHLTSTLAITEAAQRRLFFDQQLGNEKTALTAAEEDLRKTQEKTGLIQLSGQAEEIIRNVADLRAQIVSREVQMQALRTYAADQNPDVTRLKQEIVALQQQLGAVENNQRRMQPGDIQVPTGQVPEAGLEYARKLREVSYHTALLTLLSREYEAARIDEAKSAPLIQVVDHAVPPEKKSGPHRALITLAAGFVGFVFACLWVFVRQALTHMKQVQGNVEKIEELRAMLRRGAVARTGTGRDR